MFSYLKQTFLYILYIGFMLMLSVALILAIIIYDLSLEETSLEKIKDYHPPITTRVHASDGQLLYEFAKEKRVYVSIDRIPKQLQYAFIAAEDQRFYQHPGVDIRAIIRAVYTNIKSFFNKKRPVGASTITQQVARNFLLTNEVTLKRKLREAIIAIRIENVLTKEKILELYLNHIYLGLGQFGVASSALNYFDKSLDELSLDEMAYLAALPKAPSNYHPIRQKEKALERRNWVLLRMLKEKYINDDEYQQAFDKDLIVQDKILSSQRIKPSYFIEEVRQIISSKFPDNTINKDGYSVRTSLDPKLQKSAVLALRKGLIGYDRKHGWRGAKSKLEVSSDFATNWLSLLQEKPKDNHPNSIAPWVRATVLNVGKDIVSIGVENGSLQLLNIKDSAWARLKNSPVEDATDFRTILNVGDVILVECNGEKTNCTLQQLPEVDGSLIAIDPHTGRVKAMVGGWSFYRSEFNRATQAKRQPGSAFKPFVYLAALEQGYPPNTRILDAPLLIDAGADGARWRPENYSKTFFGPTTMRIGVEKSRNLMTIRLAQTLGINPIIEIARRFNINDNLVANFASALGTGETSLVKLTTAYAMLVNGGFKIKPSFIDLIQDRSGKTIFRNNNLICSVCNTEWLDSNELTPPYFVDTREKITTSENAYQIVSMLEGVIDRGTGWRLRNIDFPLAGKTGTTDNSLDTWFIGFTPDLAVGVFVGYDTPRPLTDDIFKDETGSSVAVPVWKAFIEEVIKGKSPIPFRVPAGVRFIKINRYTGAIASNIDNNTILEVFKSSDPLPTSSESQLITGLKLNQSPSNLIDDLEYIPSIPEYQDKNSPTIKKDGIY